MVREVLNEVKATGIGDNKNVLIELNIEQTRHNEIQLLGQRATGASRSAAATARSRCTSRSCSRCR